MSLTCDFVLNKVNELYSSGESVDGKVVINVPALRSIKDVAIILHGEGTVSFDAYTGGSHNDCGSEASHLSDDCPKLEKTECTADEVFVDLQQNLRDGGDWEPGDYSFPFSLALPADCPSSFEGSQGSIQYYLMVVIRNRKRRNNIFKYGINVERSYDLNLNQNNRNPVQVQRVKSFSWFNFSSGKISFVLSIPYGAYAPLQLFRYSLHVDNQSSTEVKGYTVVIKQTVTYTANTPYQTNYVEGCNVFEEEYGDECPRQCIRVFEEDFEIPAVVPTTEDNDIINIRYAFELTAFISGLTFDVQLSVPIEIGSIPVRESLQHQLAFVKSPKAALAEAPPPSYQECEPPSFEEATIDSFHRPSIESIMLTATAPPYELFET